MDSMPRSAALFPPADAESLAPRTLAARARECMAADWESGNRLPCEWYFERSPVLAADAAASLDLIFLEFVLRDEAGEAPTPEQFAARFPAAEQSLRRLIELDSALYGAEPADTTPFANDSFDSRTMPSTPWKANPALNPDAPAEPAPSAIGRYLVLETLGSGGQATVFLGVHPTLGREVVIKRLKDSSDGGGRLREEGRVLATLDHPNLAKVYDLDVADGRAFMVMESIRGRNLAEVRKHAAVPIADVKRWMAEIARATEHAHRHGVLHLDIKPRNVMVEDSGRAVLIDFGMARVERGLDPAALGDAVSGTLAYMSPEQARGENEQVGPASDVYALGGVLYFLLTGLDPIRGADATERLAKAARGDWDRDRLRQSNAPSELIAACERALNPDRMLRFPSAAAFAHAVQAPDRRPRRHRVAVAAVGVLCLALLGAWACWPPESPTREAKPAVAATPADLHLEFLVHRSGRFHSGFPVPFQTGDRWQLTALVPSGRHATLMMATERGSVNRLDSRAAEGTETRFQYPAATNPATKSELMRFAPPAGTHVFLLAVSPSGPVTAEELGLEAGTPWPRLPYDSVIRIREGRARVEARGRDIEPAGAVDDPEGEVVARLTKILRAAPADVSLEGVAFAVKLP
jgi:predicted Ser/Thr protein kinase